MLHTNNQVLDITEAKLLRMHELDRQIKILKSEYEMLKDEVCAGYFAKPGIYKTSKGLALASLIEFEQTKFNSGAFKIAKPKIYEQFCSKVTVQRFDLKK